MWRGFLMPDVHSGRVSLPGLKRASAWLTCTSRPNPCQQKRQTPPCLNLASNSPYAVAASHSLNHAGSHMVPWEYCHIMQLRYQGDPLLWRKAARSKTGLHVKHLLSLEKEPKRVTLNLAVRFLAGSTMKWKHCIILAALCLSPEMNDTNNDYYVISTCQVVIQHRLIYSLCCTNEADFGMNIFTIIVSKLI